MSGQHDNGYVNVKRVIIRMLQGIIFTGLSTGYLYGKKGYEQNSSAVTS